MNFHPPFSESLFNHADAQTSNTSTRVWFYYITTKIHPPFQNPGSAPESTTATATRKSKSNRVFSHDVTAAILVSQNNETAAMLVSQTNPLGDVLFYYANVYFCSNKFA